MAAEPSRDVTSHHTATSAPLAKCGGQGGQGQRRIVMVSASVCHCHLLFMENPVQGGGEHLPARRRVRMSRRGN